jgi:molybdopterin converting factor small subunit
MHVHLGGHLSWYDVERRAQVDLALPERVELATVAQRLGVPVGEIAIAVVNGRLAPSLEIQVGDADRVEFFPPVGGGA